MVASLSLFAMVLAPSQKMWSSAIKTGIALTRNIATYVALLDLHPAKKCSLTNTENPPDMPNFHQTKVVIHYCYYSNRLSMGRRLAFSIVASGKKDATRLPLMM